MFLSLLEKTSRAQGSKEAFVAESCDTGKSAVLCSDSPVLHVFQESKGDSPSEFLHGTKT